MATTQNNNNSFEQYDYDIIIVGQGIAGSLLAWELIQKKQRVLVIDNKHHGSSSAVAAGIINPITGHRINLTSDFKHFLKYAKSTYAQLHEAFGQKFLTAIPQARLIKNPGQQSYYQKRLEQQEYSHFLKPLSESHAYLKPKGFGVASIQQSYRVHANPLLLNIKKWLKQQNAILEKAVDYDDIFFSKNHVTLKNDSQQINAKSIIFCEGYQAIHNPWLKGLAFKLAKGEILTLKTTKTVDSMLNWGNWFLPKDANNAFLGASYQWQDTSLSTSQDIAGSLLSSLQEHTNIKATIVDHHAGIRPTTVNRKQFIGTHPKYHNLYCFNGFGSKGCLTIPYYAKTFSQHFVDGSTLTNLMPELDSNLGLNTK